MSNPYLLDPPAVVSFSGGRTSGYMLWHILQAFGGKLPDDVKVVFCNTGKERSETLDFVERCSIEWDVPVTWLEYRRDESKPLIIPSQFGQPAIGQHDFRQVNYATASRDGEPFLQLVSVKADYRLAAKDKGPVLPNVRQRWCTGEMKERTKERYFLSLGWPVEDATDAVGFRFDEPVRHAKILEHTPQSWGCGQPYDPLWHAGVTKPAVEYWWRQQSFDLQITSNEGNCDLCFLKAKWKKINILRDRPDLAQFWIELEAQTETRFRNDHPSYSKLLELSQRPGLFDDIEDRDELSIACHCTD